MAYEIPNFYVGVFPADIDMTSEASYQYAGVCVYTAVSVTGTGVGGAALINPGTFSSPILGVLQNNPQQGEAGTVMVQGVTKALIGGTVQIGDLLKVQADGTFIKATSGTYAVAMALEQSAIGDIAAILLIRNGKV